MSRTRRSWLDRVGAVVGLGCAVHCLLLPVLAGVLPLVGDSGVGHPWVELGLLGMAAGVASVAAVHGWLGRGPSQPSWLLGLGTLLLVVRLWRGEDGVPGGHALTVGVSLLLVTGHLWRAREARAC